MAPLVSGPLRNSSLQYQVPFNVHSDVHREPGADAAVMKISLPYGLPVQGHKEIDEVKISNFTN